MELSNGITLEGDKVVAKGRPLLSNFWKEYVEHAHSNKRHDTGWIVRNCRNARQQPAAVHLIYNLCSGWEQRDVCAAFLISSIANYLLKPS